MSIKEIFDRNKINTGRQHEADLLRGFTVIILIICHVGYFMPSTEGMYYFADIIGSETGAPVFMSLMGFSIMFSRHTKPIEFLKRGIILFIGGYVLNIFRSLIPYFIFGDIDYFSSINGFFVVDILQFAGLAFMLIALLKKLKLPNWAILIISFIFVVISQILMSIPEIKEISSPLSYLVSLFIPLVGNDYCCFPLLLWFIYPSFGLVLGELMTHVKNKDKFYLLMLIPGIIGVIVLYGNIIVRFPDYATYYYGGCFYHMGIFNTIVTLLVVCFCFSIWHFIGEIWPQKIVKLLTFWSINTTEIYVSSWIVISILIHLQAYYSWTFTPIAIIGLIIAVLAACSYIALIYKRIKRKIIKVG